MSEVKNNSAEAKETPTPVKTGKGNTYDELLGVARNKNTESATEENAEQPQEQVEDNAVETEENKEEVAKEEEESVSEDTDNKEATEKVDVESRVKELQEKEELTDDEVKFLEDNGYEVTVEEKEETVQENKEEVKNEEDIGIPKYAETLLNLYPNEKIDSKDEAESLLNRHLENEKNVTNQLGNIIKNNPELSDVLKDMMNNKTDFMTAITTHLDIEGSKPVPGDDNYEQWVEQKIIRKQQKEQEQKRIEILEQNKKSSAEVANSYVKDKGLDTNTRSEFFTKIDAVVQSLNQGKVDDQMLDIFFKGMNYEKDIAVAEKKGEIMGANKKIFTIKRKEGAVMPKVTSNSAIKSKQEQQYTNESARKLDAFLGKSKPRTPRR